MAVTLVVVGIGLAIRIMWMKLHMRWPKVFGFVFATYFVGDAPRRFAHAHFFLAAAGLEAAEASVCF